MVEATQETAPRQSSDLGHHVGSRASIAFSFLMSLGAAAAGSCCALPLALASVGIGGAWLGSLATLALYRPYILSIAVVGLAIGWTMAIRKHRRRTREPQSTYERRPTSRWTFGVLMLSTLLVVFATISNWLEPLIVQALLEWERGP
jgi:mercuric ion transport protein